MWANEMQTRDEKNPFPSALIVMPLLRCITSYIWNENKSREKKTRELHINGEQIIINIETTYAREMHACVNALKICDAIHVHFARMH